jgi:hypothetical protein
MHEVYIVSIHTYKYSYKVLRRELSNPKQKRMSMYLMCIIWL